ncbi:MAG: gliding motility-associated ABC transporter ATP-binding subunit GldA [Draconibacterium sp.]|nr:MAG: gliding motility-associated ABC transporter ATP-binding subunit GldA [Draconibacterium sp.]
MSIVTSNITKLFGKQKALNDVSLMLKKGELAGFLGPNGAGKSTMMKIITGFLAADEGEVLVNGQKILPEKTNIRKDIGYLPEHNPLYTDLYVKESLAITAGFYGLKNRTKCIAEMVDLTGLGDEQHKKIGALSKGYRQRVGLAQALIHNPSVLILDEPTTGLDPNQLDEIRNLIKEISKEKTVMLSSHIMQEVEAVCNRVIIINHGKIVADGDIVQLKKGVLRRSQVVIAEFSNPMEIRLLQKISGVKNVTGSGHYWELESNGERDIRPDIFRFAASTDNPLLTLQEKQDNLEGLFRKLTQKN